MMKMQPSGPPMCGGHTAESIGGILRGAAYAQPANPSAPSRTPRPPNKANVSPDRASAGGNA